MSVEKEIIKSIEKAKELKSQLSKLESELSNNVSDVSTLKR